MNRNLLQQILGFGISIVLIYVVFFDPQPVRWYQGRSAATFPVLIEEVRDPVSLATTIKSGERPGDLLIVSRLSPAGQDWLQQYTLHNHPGDSLVAHLVAAINRSMEVETLPSQFGAGVLAAASDLPENPDRRAIQKRNRIAIETAFPRIIKAFPFTAAEGWFKLRFNVKDLKEVFRILRYGPAFMAFFTLIISLWVRAWRWKVLVEPIGKTSMMLTFHTTNIGYLMNNVLPFRIGEVLRGILLARKAGLPIPAVLTTCALDRLFDLLGLGMIFGISLLAYDFPEWLRVGGLIIVAGVLGSLLIGYVLSRTPERVEAWVGRRVYGRRPLLQKVAAMFVSLLNGLGVLKNWRMMAQVLVSTFILWFMYALAMKFVLDAFSLTNSDAYPELKGLAIIQSMAITVVSALGMSIPSAPGAVGTYHKSVMIGLDFFGVPGSISAIFATAMHALNYVTLTIMGLISLWSLKLSISELKRLYERHADVAEIPAPPLDAPPEEADETKQ